MMGNNKLSLKIQLNPKQIGSLYYLFTFLIAGTLQPFINVYFQKLGFSGKQIGFLSILSPLMILLLSTVISSLADRKRIRIIIAQIGLIGVAIGQFLLRIPDSFPLIAGLMFIIAIFNSPVSPIADSLIARMAKRQKLNYGGMRLWGSIGFIVSSLVGGSLWQLFSYKAMFLVASLLHIPLIFLVSNLKEIPVSEETEREPFIEIFKNPKLMIFLFVTIIASVANSLTIIFNGVYASWLGGGSILIGLMTGLGALGELPMMFFSERIGKRFSKVKVIVFAFGIMALSFVAFSVTNNPVLLPIFTFVKCIGYGLWFPLTISVFTDLTPEEWASSSQSLLTMSMFGIAQLIAGPLGGFIYDIISPRAIYYFGTICLIIAGIILWTTGVKESHNSKLGGDL